MSTHRERSFKGLWESSSIPSGAAFLQAWLKRSHPLILPAVIALMILWAMAHWRD